MRLVIQRASQASVSVSGTVLAQFHQPGLVVLVGIAPGDGQQQVEWLAAKVWQLRIFRDEKSAADLDAPILAVSQFTLYGDARKGRRPSWNGAASSKIAEPVFTDFVAALRRLGASVYCGKFGADMQVSLINDGPVTLVLEAPK